MKGVILENFENFTKKTIKSIKISIFILLISFTIAGSFSTFVPVSIAQESPKPGETSARSLNSSANLVESCSLKQLDPKSAVINELTALPANATQDQINKRFEDQVKPVFFQNCFQGVLRLAIVFSATAAIFQIILVGLSELNPIGAPINMKKRVQDLVIGLALIALAWNIVPLFNAAFARANFLNPPSYQTQSLEKAFKLQELSQRIQENIDNNDTGKPKTAEDQALIDECKKTPDTAGCKDVNEKLTAEAQKVISDANVFYNEFKDKQVKNLDKLTSDVGKTMNNYISALNNCKNFSSENFCQNYQLKVDEIQSLKSGLIAIGNFNSSMDGTIVAETMDGNNKVDVKVIYSPFPLPYIPFRSDLNVYRFRAVDKKFAPGTINHDKIHQQFTYLIQDAKTSSNGAYKEYLKNKIIKSGNWELFLGLPLFQPQIILQSAEAVSKSIDSL
jgi:hypothetical protein